MFARILHVWCFRRKMLSVMFEIEHPQYDMVPDITGGLFSQRVGNREIVTNFVKIKRFWYFFSGAHFTYMA